MAPTLPGFMTGPSDSLTTVEMGLDQESGVLVRKRPWMRKMWQRNKASENRATSPIQERVRGGAGPGCWCTSGVLLGLSWKKWGTRQVSCALDFVEGTFSYSNSLQELEE